MKGFVVYNQTELSSENAEHYQFNNTNYYIEHQGCQLYYDKQQHSLLIIDGYFIGTTFTQLLSYISNNQFEKLSQIDGHYCGLYLNEQQCIGFNDRFGGRTLYWRTDLSLIVASQAAKLPVQNSEYDKTGLYESLIYRWNIGEQTLLKHVKQLKPRHYINFFQPEQQLAYWQLGTPQYNDLALTEKVAQTHKYLLNNLKKAQRDFNKVAVFLSGGVDSSILAALSKEVFEHCVLITPVFKNEENPELATALAFAEQLALEHILVEIDTEQLEADFLQLVQLKRAPLRHYSSLAIMAMMRAVPQDCQAIVYGEAADTLFGSNSIKRFTTHVTWKRRINWLPNFFFTLLKKIDANKAKLLQTIKNSSYQDLAAALTAIKYQAKERALINTFDYHEPEEHNDNDIKKLNNGQLRYFAQNKVISTDVAVHFQEMELISQLFDKKVISPFFDAKVLALSTTLNEQDYYGQGYVKPILRELACKHFDRELIYQRKYGFPVPYIAWLNAPLNKLVNKAYQEKELFDGKLLQSLSIENSYETYWIAINLLLVRDQLAAQTH